MLHFHTLTIQSIAHTTPEAIVVTFDVPESLKNSFQFVQGQHVTLRCEIDGEDVRRSYSICCGVSHKHIKVGIKRVPGGVFSEYAHKHFKPGQQVDVMAPTGSFHTPLNASEQKRYAAFVAGSGITPVMSIIETTLSEEPDSSFMLFYGNQTRQSIMFLEELEALKNRYLNRLSLHYILSREPQEVELYNGRIDQEKVTQLSRVFAPVEHVDSYFICGPASMIDNAEQALLEMGARAEQIHIERFGTVDQNTVSRKPAPVEASGDSCNVTVILDGHKRVFSMPFSGQTLLDAAAEAGLDMPFSCKGGVCGTCRTKLVSGKVDIQQDYALEPWEKEAGFVLACQARPLSDDITLNYDEV